MDQATHILFVCTGNIFRSLTAEYALRRALSAQTHVRISSAGTADFPHVVSPVVSAYLSRQGLDVSAHVRRTLTADIALEADLVVAMSTDHQQFLHDRFGQHVPLFMQACGLGAAPLLDVDEAVPDYQTNALAAAAHVHKIIDQIIVLTPLLAHRIVRGDLELERWRQQPGRLS